MKEIVAFILLVLGIIFVSGGAIAHGIAVNAQRNQLAEAHPAWAILCVLIDLLGAAAGVAGGGVVGISPEGAVSPFGASNPLNNKSLHNNASNRDVMMLVNALINDKLVQSAGLDIYLKQIRDGQEVNINDAIMQIRNEFPKEYEFLMKFKKDRSPVPLTLSGIPDFKMVLDEYKRFRSMSTSGGGKRKNRTHKRKTKRN